MQRSEDLEIRIIKELTSPSSFRWDIRESYASIAAKIGVDEETVRRRVNRARKSGFLKGWQIVLNPHLIERESGGVQLEVDNEERKLKVLAEIERLDGVVIMVNFNGRAFRVIFYHQNEQDLAMKIRQMTAICGRRELVLWRGGFPPSKLKLGRTDWEIIRALRKDPRRSPTEIAHDAGVSTRTVRRRLKIMTEARAFYLLPILDYDMQIGVSPDYLVYCPDEKKKQLIDKQVRSKLDRIVFAFTDAPGFSIYAMVCKNLSEAEEIRGWIRSMEGVRDVLMDTMRSNNVVKGWLDGEIDKHLSQLSSHSGRV